MKKLLFGVFAHPDDEAFGPSGTLLTETKNGTELHLVTLTLGGAGMNPDNYDNLETIREDEWRHAGALLHASTMTMFGYKDGQLCNQSMITIGTRLVDLVLTTIATRADIDSIEFMTNDLNGISGHIDHIVAARATAWAFYTLKAQKVPVNRIRFACLPRKLLPQSNVKWLYMEAGHKDEEIDEINDATQYRKELTAIIRQHHSQRQDGEMHISARGASLGIDYFIVKR